MSPGTAWLNSVYPVPDPFFSLEQAQRHMHADLACLSPAELTAERKRVEMRLLLSSDLDRSLDWLEERLAAIKRTLHG